MLSIHHVSVVQVRHQVAKVWIDGLLAENVMPEPLEKEPTLPILLPVRFVERRIERNGERVLIEGAWSREDACSCDGKLGATSVKQKRWEWAEMALGPGAKIAIKQRP